MRPTLYVLNKKTKMREDGKNPALVDNFPFCVVLTDKNKIVFLLEPSSSDEIKMFISRCQVNYRVGKDANGSRVVPFINISVGAHLHPFCLGRVTGRVRIKETCVRLQ